MNKDLIYEIKRNLTLMGVSHDKVNLLTENNIRTNVMSSIEGFIRSLYKTVDNKMYQKVTDSTGELVNYGDVKLTKEEHRELSEFLGKNPTSNNRTTFTPTQKTGNFTGLTKNLQKKIITILLKQEPKFVDLCVNEEIEILKTTLNVQNIDEIFKIFYNRSPNDTGYIANQLIGDYYYSVLKNAGQITDENSEIITKTKENLNKLYDEWKLKKTSQVKTPTDVTAWNNLFTTQEGFMSTLTNDLKNKNIEDFKTIDSMLGYTMELFIAYSRTKDSKIQTNLRIKIIKALMKLVEKKDNNLTYIINAAKNFSKDVLSKTNVVTDTAKKEEMDMAKNRLDEFIKIIEGYSTEKIGDKTIENDLKQLSEYLKFSTKIGAGESAQINTCELILDSIIRGGKAFLTPTKQVYARFRLNRLNKKLKSANSQNLSKEDAELKELLNKQIQQYQNLTKYGNVDLGGIWGFRKMTPATMELVARASKNKAKLSWVISAFVHATLSFLWWSFVEAFAEYIQFVSYRNFTNTDMQKCYGLMKKINVDGKEMTIFEVDENKISEFNKLGCNTSGFMQVAYYDYATQPITYNENGETIEVMAVRDDEKNNIFSETAENMKERVLNLGKLFSGESKELLDTPISDVSNVFGLWGSVINFVNALTVFIGETNVKDEEEYKSENVKELKNQTNSVGTQIENVKDTLKTQSPLPENSTNEVLPDGK